MRPGPARGGGRFKTGKDPGQAGVEKNPGDCGAKVLQLLGGREGMGGPSEGEDGGQRRAAPSAPRTAAAAPAPRQAPAARPASGFDDMDDDIPF